MKWLLTLVMVLIPVLSLAEMTVAGKVNLMVWHDDLGETIETGRALSTYFGKESGLQWVVMEGAYITSLRYSFKTTSWRGGGMDLRFRVDKEEIVSGDFPTFSDDHSVNLLMQVNDLGDKLNIQYETYRGKRVAKFDTSNAMEAYNQHCK